MIRSLSEWKTRSNQEIRALEAYQYVDVSQRIHTPVSVYSRPIGRALNYSPQGGDSSARFAGPLSANSCMRRFLRQARQTDCSRP